MTIWDDFRVFELRREDRFYEKPELTWGDISRKYLFTAFRNNKPPYGMYDLLDKLYRIQYTSGERDFLRPNMNNRNQKIILSERIPSENKKELIRAITEKEDTQTYLSNHYLSMVKQYRQIEMITFSFYLPDNDNKSIRAENTFTRSLMELRKRFTSLKKQIMSDPLYKSVRGYSRLILMTVGHQPFYLVNFFFIKHPDAYASTYISSDIYDKWANTGAPEQQEDPRVVCYKFSDGPRLKNRRNDPLRFHNASQVVNVGQEIDILDLIEYKFSGAISHNRKGYLAFFRLQAQIYNSIPGVRTRTSSNNFTYLNTEERKKRKREKEKIQIRKSV
ncbi:TPA: hypothetical protein ACGQTY_003831 [Citrobacter farmeri]|uniref:hypothetical protein n=1 Tax=Enterobacterales TaxID=91347 RepID=UPI0008FD04AF|nr:MULTISPECIES: hypothetical protein [Enterobacterales]KAA0262298.1 hypothetical protein ERL64_11665 [Hafnia alvei]MCE9881796.1 hypothetical protein [Hafnia paralvei]MCE9908140.1 hypothetical protein [Hafnia paralvei]MCE9911059.1 hypothetical protein [Hafnia paralvei]MDB2163855.1 hypothetical protein [Citrobacter farmeri]